MVPRPFGERTSPGDDQHRGSRRGVAARTGSVVYDSITRTATTKFRRVIPTTSMTIDPCTLKIGGQDIGSKKTLDSGDVREYIVRIRRIVHDTSGTTVHGRCPNRSFPTWPGNSTAICAQCGRSSN